MLKLDENEPCRVVFNEITKTVIQKAVKNPRCIDRNLVDAQQARRVLDRLLGYKISPLLWAKVRRGLSAGRVQSVTTKLICDREREILDFVPKEYWTVTVKLHLAKRTFEAKFYGLTAKDGASDGSRCNARCGFVHRSDLLRCGHQNSKKNTSCACTVHNEQHASGCIEPRFNAAEANHALRSAAL